MFPDELRVSSFPDRFHHYVWTAAWSAHSDFVSSRVYACLGLFCHLHFWQNDRGLLRATAVTRGWSGHRINVSTQSYVWRRKFSSFSCRDSSSQPFDHESGALPTSYPGSSDAVSNVHFAVARFCIRTLEQSVAASDVYKRQK